MGTDTVSGRIQVHHMQVFCTSRPKSARQRNRILVVNRHVVIAALAKPDRLPVEKVDRRVNDEWLLSAHLCVPPGTGRSSVRVTQSVSRARPVSPLFSG